MDVSRRFFIGGAASFGALVTSPMFALAGAAAMGGARLKLGVVSDLHFMQEGDEATFLKALKYFAAKGVDAVICAGDISDRGLKSELKRCLATWNQVFPDDKAADGHKVERLWVYGNHDVWAGDWNKFKEDCISWKCEYGKSWEECFHEPYEHIWFRRVKGIPVMGAHWRQNGKFTEVPAAVAAHAKDIDPNEPFLYIQHAHPKNTVFGSWAWGHDAGESTQALSKYPKAVAFSGHSHYTLVDERSVWQGAFTSINASCLRYAGRDYPLRENACGDKRFNYVYDEKVRTKRMKCICDQIAKPPQGQQGMFVALYDDHLAVERRDFVHDQPLGDDWVVPLPAGADAPFAFARHAAHRSAPEFDKGAKVSVKVTKPKDEKDFTHIDLAFPAAKTVNKCRVNEYEATAVLVEDDVELIQAQRRMMSPDYFLPETMLAKEATFTFAAEDLPLKGHYRFEIRPLECFGKKGEKIVSDVVVIG